MKVLFTGSSSFTGMWFIKKLLEAGAEATACFSSSYKSYTGVRLKRIDQILKQCECVFETTFGTNPFLELVSRNRWDLFCHHAADVNNYKSPAFNVAAALQNNTHNLKIVLESLLEQGCSRMVLTGTVFEESPAVSPYGLSKRLTTEVFEFYAKTLGLNLHIFTIPNPFGPFEEERFTTYLVKKWFQAQVPMVLSPMYIRDNVPVSLLAEAYANFAMKSDKIIYKPSFYKESVQAFSSRFSKEMSERLNLACPLDIRHQIDFSEPLERVNSDTLDPRFFNWDEKKGWDELACFYKDEYGSK